MIRISCRLLLKFLTLFFTISLLSACCKDDTLPKLDTALLYGKQWQLIKVNITENGKNFDELTAACQQDDLIEFKADKIFIRDNGQNLCGQESGSVTSQWSIFQDPKVIIFENIEYDIIELSQTKMDLQKEHYGINGNVMVKYYYIPK